MNNHQSTYYVDHPRTRKNTASYNSRRRDNGNYAHHNPDNTNVAAVTPRRPSKRIFTREIGLLMLVFAAQTLAEVSSLGASLLSTDLMADASSYSGRPSAAGDDDGCHHDFCYSSYSSTPPGGKYVSYIDPTDGALTSSASAGSDDEDDDNTSNGRSGKNGKTNGAGGHGRGKGKKERFSEEDALALLSMSLRLFFSQEATVWDRVMGYLPLRDTLELRRASRFMLRRSLNFAAVLRMPYTHRTALFVPCRSDLDANEAAIEAGLSSSSAAATAAAASWNCRNCGRGNDAARGRCAANWCSQPRPDTSLSSSASSSTPTVTAGGCRMFLGQLRRNGTVAMVEWLVNYVFNAPRGALLCVENHRNATTGRGKGCAWPTIAHDATVRSMLSAQHRLFYDRVNGVEGVWVVPHGSEPMLRAETDAPARGGKNHLKFMPRGVMVFELPSGGSQQRPQQQNNINTNDSRAAAAAVTPRSDAGSYTSNNYSPYQQQQQRPQTQEFRCPAPRSAQQQQQQAYPTYHHRVSTPTTTTATTSIRSFSLTAGNSTEDRCISPGAKATTHIPTTTATTATTPTRTPETCGVSDGEDCGGSVCSYFTPYYDMRSGRLYTAPNTYRHQPYAPFIFQI